MDDYLVQFFENNSITVEVFKSAGLDIVKIGEGKIQLKELLDLNIDIDDQISAVLASSMQIIGTRKERMLGSVDFKIRMRNPIAKLLKYKRQQELLGDIDVGIEKRLEGALETDQ